MDTAAKTGLDAAKTSSKRAVQKTAEATGNLIGNKIAVKITSIAKSKSDDKTKKVEEIPPEKRQQINDDLRLFWYHLKMELQKILNLLDKASDDKDLLRFVTKKWIEDYDQSEKNCNVKKEIRFNTPMLRLDLCDYSDAYIVLKGVITVIEPENAKRNKSVVFKNNAPFINCISKIYSVQIDNAKDLDVVMPMYSLLDYSKNYRKTTGSWWNYYRDEPSNPLSYNSESFKYKTSITGNNYNLGVSNADYDANKVGKNETEVPILLKHLNNFWKALNVPLINCEIEMILTWSKNCVLADITSANNSPTELEFQITGTLLYVLVVDLSNENDKKLLEQLISGFKRTAKWNKYRSQMTIQPQDDSLNYLINPRFTKVNRLFVLSFVRNATGDHRDSFSHYYVPKVEINDFNVLIDGKSFFDLPVKNKEEAYEKIIEITRNNDYTTGNLLDFAYFKKLTD